MLPAGEIEGPAGCRGPSNTIELCHRSLWPFQVMEAKARRPGPPSWALAATVHCDRICHAVGPSARASDFKVQSWLLGACAVHRSPCLKCAPRSCEVYGGELDQKPAGAWWSSGHSSFLLRKSLCVCGCVGVICRKQLKTRPRTAAPLLLGAAVTEQSHSPSR